MIRQIEWGVQDGLITKNGVLPVSTLVFRKFCLILRVDLMYQPPTCPYSYFSKALEFYLRMLFRCEYPKTSQTQFRTKYVLEILT